MAKSIETDQQVREKLVDFAYDIYQERGRGLALRPIWEGVGIGVNRFNRLFGSEEALIAAIVDEAYQGLRIWSQDTLSTSNSTDRSKDWTLEMVTVLLNYRDLADLLLEALLWPGAPLHPMASGLQQITERFLTLTPSALNPQPAGDAEAAFITILASVSASEKLCHGFWEDALAKRTILVKRLFNLRSQLP